jgi:hypothetical protein
MMIALVLEDHGYAARKAMLVAQSIVRQSPPSSDGQHRGEDCFFLIDKPDSRSYVAAFGQRALTEALKARSALFLVVNVSTHVRKLNDALDLALATV